MNKKNSILSARLLAGKDQPAVMEREDILKRVLQKTQAAAVEQQPSQIFKKLSWAVSLGLILLATISVILYFSSNDVDPDEMRAKGSGVSPFGFTVHCLQNKICSPGDKLVFQIVHPKDKVFFSSFAVAEDQTIIWYFPGQRSEESINLKEQVKDGLLSVAVEIGPEHTPSQYTVHALLSKISLSRDQIRDIFEQKAGFDDNIIILPNQKFVLKEIAR